jgi:hypothetical protein
MPDSSLNNSGNPSPNGPNGDGRDSQGRFAKGNPGGPGNPFVRRVASLRNAMLDAVTEDDLRSVVQAVVGKAKAGDLAAAKLLLDYCIGRPPEAIDPDRAELEAMKLDRERRREQAGPLAALVDWPG